MPKSAVIDSGPLIALFDKDDSNVPMDFADAILVVTAEKFNIRHVASIDSDFYVCRTLSNGYLTNLIQLQNQ